MRALITGGKGFVGQWLAAHLKDHGDEVASSTSRPTWPTGPPCAGSWPTWHPTPSTTWPRMTHVGESWEDPSQVLRVNVLGTAEVLAAARTLPSRAPGAGGELGRGLRRGRAPSSCRWARTTPTAPASPYAASKLAAEAVALQAWRGYGQPVIVVRPFNHIGPGQSPNFFVPALAKRIVEAAPVGRRLAAGRDADHRAGTSPTSATSSSPTAC